SRALEKERGRLYPRPWGAARENPMLPTRGAKPPSPLLRKLAMESHGAIGFWLKPVVTELFSPGSILSVYSLATTFCIAVLALAYRHRARRGRANFKAIGRAIFNMRLLRHESFSADVKLVILSVVIAPPIMASLAISANGVSMVVCAALKSLFGP